MRKIKTTYKRYKHKLTAHHSYGFGIHSPFLFGLTKFIIYNKNPFYIFEKIESLSRVRAAEKKTKSSNLKLNSSRDRFDLDPKRKRERQLLFRIVNELRPHSILELGVEQGISTAYLASGNPKAVCTALLADGARISDIKENLKNIGAANVILLDTNLQDALGKITQDSGKLDLLFINPSVTVDLIRSCFQQSLPLIHNNTVFVFSDLHSSKEREALWRELTLHQNTTAYIDLFSLGFLFFRKDLAKKKYKMRF